MSETSENKTTEQKCPIWVVDPYTDPPYYIFKFDMDGQLRISWKPDRWWAPARNWNATAIWQTNMGNEWKRASDKNVNIAIHEAIQKLSVPIDLSFRICASEVKSSGGGSWYTERTITTYRKELKKTKTA